jgi:hypothetical protein
MFMLTLHEKKQLSPQASGATPTTAPRPRNKPTSATASGSKAVSPAPSPTVPLCDKPRVNCASCSSPCRTHKPQSALASTLRSTTWMCRRSRSVLIGMETSRRTDLAMAAMVVSPRLRARGSLLPLALLGWRSQCLDSCCKRIALC